MWDSVYFQASNTNRRYELGGTIYKGSELNYYGIGMLMRREGKSDFGTGLTVILWKEANIP